MTHFTLRNKHFIQKTGGVSVDTLQPTGVFGLPYAKNQAVLYYRMGVVCCSSSQANLRQIDGEETHKYTAFVDKFKYDIDMVKLYEACTYVFLSALGFLQDLEKLSYRSSSRLNLACAILSDKMRLMQSALSEVGVSPTSKSLSPADLPEAHWSFPEDFDLSNNRGTNIYIPESSYQRHCGLQL